MRTTLIIGMPAILLTGFSVLRSVDPVMPADVAAEFSKLGGKVDFNRQVKPILSDKCFACHGPDRAKQQAGLRLDRRESAVAQLPESPGRYAIRPGDFPRSEVYRRIVSMDPDYRMPTPASHLSLSAKEKAVIAKWIEQGAEYRPHWAFVKPVRHSPPGLPPSLQTQHPVDRFIRSRLHEEGLSPAPEAPRELLLRRLSLDLTGLPPTPAETDAFLADTAPGAYERQVDRLLASPHYGERMAADWLDIARFADSHGYTVDRLRDMSPYRDWVIAAYNAGMPYDRFIHEQLAGDLMPSPTRDMLIATAFNRNHPQNAEGGIVEEEFQAEYVFDRTNTFGEAFMALSLGCARCHDHKYDPVSQKEYFGVYSFFNNILEPGQISFNDDLPTPTLLLPTEEQEKVMQSLERMIKDQESRLQKAESDGRAAAEWIGGHGYGHLSREAMPQSGLRAHFRLDGGLSDRLDTSLRGEMKHEAGVRGDLPVFVADRGGQVLSLDGDVYLDLSPAGVFRRSEPFTVGMWVRIPKELREGVIFHKSEAERLYNYKGFHVQVKDGRFEVLMAHSAPSNAIIMLSRAPVPRDRWTHLSLTYDGSSRAEGLRLHVDGRRQDMDLVKDRLYKDIVFHRDREPGLQIGGWWRGLGFRGGRVSDVVVYDRSLTDHELAVLAGRAGWQALASKPPGSLTDAERGILAAYHASALDTSVRREAARLKRLRTALSDTVRHVRQLMVMEEMPAPRRTRVLLRGRYDMPGEEVDPGTPREILGYPSTLPRDRYGLAQWLTHPDHPLTARVAVNRLWQQFFGIGLVKTSEDFGNQGEMPSHPELLDWLAVTFREGGWDVKRLVRLIVTSHAYRQDSRATPAQREADPENRLLARGPSARLTAEMLRDNALAAAGILQAAIGGRSMKPYQPDGLWEINSMGYRADSTREMHRRSLYIVAKRSVPFPTLASFDASERSSCLSRRQRTNTPLQALVSLNDPAYMEASKMLGVRMAALPDTASAIREGYRRLAGRHPSPQELEVLSSLHRRSLERFAADPARMKGILGAGILPVPPEADKALVAAYAVVASAILNSDATIMKR